MRLIECDRLTFYRAKDPASNAARTEALIEVCKDVARLPAVRELVMGDSWNAFLASRRFCPLKRPHQSLGYLTSTSVVGL
ncbi:hypothetical protein [Kyrpidia tusciae]|nr:hypothetical protein [Kyrpidia tusciae]